MSHFGKGARGGWSIGSLGLGSRKAVWVRSACRLEAVDVVGDGWRFLGVK